MAERASLDHKDILDFAIDDLIPEIKKIAAENLGQDSLRINFTESDEELSSLLPQLHLTTSWQVKNKKQELFVRIGKRPNCRVLTVFGVNPDSHVGVVEVNGNDSWIKKLEEELETLFRDGYSCTPDTD